MMRSTSLLALLFALPFTLQANDEAALDRLRLRQELEIARSRTLSRRPAQAPDFLGPSLTPGDLERDLSDLAALDPELLLQGDWRLLRTGAAARHLSWSGDGGALGWIDVSRNRLEVWMFEGSPVSRPLPGEGRPGHVDYLSLDQDGSRALVGVHRFRQAPQLLDQLDHFLVATDGPERLLASSPPSPHLRLGGAAFAGDRVMLLQTTLSERGPVAPWSLPGELRALWIPADFESPEADLDRRGVDYTLLDAPPTRTLPPAWAPVAERMFLGMGVTREDTPEADPVLVLRGLKKNGSHPGVFAELEQPGNLAFQVPGAPLSLAPAPDASLFAYTHGPVGSFLDQGFGPSFQLSEDGHLARISKGFWLLRPGKDPVLVPHPHGASCYQVAWRPDGLEIAVATDLDEDGLVDLCLYDLTAVLRNQQRRQAIAAEIARTEREAAEAAARKAAQAEAQRQAAEARRQAAAAREREEAARRRQQEARARAAAEAEREAEAQRQAAAREAQRLAKLEEARLALEAGEATRAVAAVQAAEDLGAEGPETRALAAAALLSQGRFPEARDRFQELAGDGSLPAARRRSFEARALLAEGEIALAEGKVGPGLASMARSLSRWPDGSNPAYPRLVEECHQRKLSSDGQRFVRQWIENGGGDPARILEVRLLSGAGEHDQALQRARELVHRNSFSAPEKVLLGDTLLAADQAGEAVKIYQEARTLDPEFPGIEDKLFGARAQEAATRDP